MNKIKELETKISKIPINKLRSDESIDLMVNYAAIKSSDLIGMPDILNLPEDVNVHVDGETTFIGDFSKKLDTLYLLTHTGIDIPRKKKYLSQMNLDNWQDITHALYSNRDAGTMVLLNELAARMKSESNCGYNYAILVYNYNRNAVDSNRVRPDEQIYDNPYKGISLWKQGVDKVTLFEELIKPFYDNIKKIVEECSPGFIFHPHTYDTYSGEGHSHHSHDKHKGKRPTGMIFNTYAFSSEAFGIYGEETDSIQSTFLSENEIKVIQGIQNSYIEKLEELDEKAECTIDFPYVSPRQLPGAIKKFYGGPQLILEYRKDLFALKNGLSEIVNSAIDIGKSIPKMR